MKKKTNNIGFKISFLRDHYWNNSLSFLACSVDKHLDVWCPWLASQSSDKGSRLCVLVVRLGSVLLATHSDSLISFHHCLNHHIKKNVTLGMKVLQMHPFAFLSIMSVPTNNLQNLTKLGTCLFLHPSLPLRCSYLREQTGCLQETYSPCRPSQIPGPAWFFLPVQNLSPSHWPQVGKRRMMMDPMCSSMSWEPCILSLNPRRVNTIP